MKRSSKSSGHKLPGALFTLVCFAGAITGLLFFWMDINQVLVKRSEDPVGTLSYKRHVVQRRFEDRLVWNQIPRESPVYNGDLIRTANLSDAVITFVSKDSVSLSENSLVHIRYDEETSSFIELLSGDVSLISASGRLGILSGNQKMLPESGGILRVRRGAEGTEARVLEGRTEISSPGAVRNLEAGQAVKAGPDETVDMAEILVVSTPLPNQELQAAENPSPVTFSWNRLSPAEYVRLEIARDRNFTELVYAADEYDTTGTVVPLPPGAWWWRMFQAEQGSPPPASAAQDGRLLIMEPPPAAVPDIAFGLSPDPAAGTGEDTFKLPVLWAVPAAPTPAAPPVLPPMETAPPETPPVQTIPPPPTAPDLLPAPEGLFPPPDAVIDPVYLKTNDRIVFGWDPVAGANAYILTIRRGLSVNLYLVREPRFVFTGLASLDNGEWQWQVEAVSLSASGETRRHGELADSGFRLDVPRPDAPEVDNPGIIYER
ncbi:MAG: hypothetical protein LBS06_03780 [Treponema sp.]|jgi:hypothetical protein|nr:hypothetical protein [Treponema sp.]